MTYSGSTKDAYASDIARLKQIPRKLLHTSISILVVKLWLSHPDVRSLLRVLCAALGIISAADVLRFNSPAFEVTYEKYLGYFMTVNGTIYYLVGTIFCLTLYPRASVFGRLLGRHTPRLPLSGTLFGAKKSLAGTIAATIVGTAASYIFWSQYAALGDEGDLSWIPGRMASPWTGPRCKPPTSLPQLPSPDSTLPVATLALVHGLVAGVAEAFDVYGIDDNLSLPVLFGLGAWSIMKSEGGNFSAEYHALANSRYPNTWRWQRH
ncbi:Diacylglycerol kinase [Microbotryomycetes sp. JL201]|nr:Diacylglycerol kinase [Microbotryomycetes sp. JL201]